MDQDSNVSHHSTITQEPSIQSSSINEEPLIQVLPEHLVNKIAAGEVIERPASVIKELIENAIDANATQVDVEIKDAGKELIKIKDNGDGMSKQDARLSIQRHATSKLKTAADLFNIQSLGFRGEALASIAAVSFLTIITKEANKSEATKLTIHAGNIVKEDIAAHAKGTTFKVQNLFFNTPARKKFMKSNHLEIKHIINIVQQYSLLHNNIAFTLTIDGKTILQSPQTQDTLTNIAAIYGNKSIKELLRVDNTKSNSTNQEEQENPETQTKPKITVQGFVSKPLAAKSDKSAQSLFVNGRYVKSKLISDAIYEAYHSTLFTQRHPIYVLKVTLDPKSIDVNVHPNKMEIKIEQKEEVFAAVYGAVKAALETNSLIPEDTVKSEQLTFAAPAPDTRVLPETPKYQFEGSNQTVFTNQDVTNIEPTTTAEPTNEHTPAFQTPTVSKSFIQAASDTSTEQQTQAIHTEPETKIHSQTSAAIASPATYSYSPKSSLIQENTSLTDSQASDGTHSHTESIVVPDHQTDNFVEGSTKFPEMKILGQIHKTFFVAETPGGMLLIDQHVVEERVLYEQFMNEHLNKHVHHQTLLKPEILTFTPTQSQVLINNLDQLKELGFTISHFGGNDFSLSTTPSILGRTQQNYHHLIEQIIKDIENFTRQSQKTIHNLQEEIITMMACRASVKAGDTMTIPQIKKLLKKLTSCTLPYTCPHGRAIVIKISADELEKKFLRHG